MLTTFLNDNKFTQIGSSQQGEVSYVRSLAGEVGKCGNLDAHVKVTFTNATLAVFSIHGTIRTIADANALGKGRYDAGAQGRAIWIYPDAKYKVPRDQDRNHWKTNGGITAPQLLGYCRKVAASVSNWSVEISRLAQLVATNTPREASNLDEIQSWY